MLRHLNQPDLNSLPKPAHSSKMNLTLKTIRDYAKIIKNAYTAHFSEEIDSPIMIPSSHIKYAKQYSTLLYRANHEVQLRRVAKFILQSYQTSERSSVIDIGAWIGDNSLIWAKLVEPFSGRVLAIDPSSQNIEAINQLSAFNSITNLRTQRAICSSIPGDHYTYCGYSVDDNKVLKPLFERSYGTIPVKSMMSSLSTTIDALYLDHLANKVLLFHVDVEGMENEIFQGSKSMIEASKPYIIFESHISSDQHLTMVIDTLRSCGYDTFFMINEVLHGARLDCRNFLAVHSSDINKNSLKQLNFENIYQNNKYLFRAFPSALALLPFDIA